jgi:CubicO group peptidase (beta-lactamase class C family)
VSARCRLLAAAALLLSLAPAAGAQDRAARVAAAFPAVDSLMRAHAARTHIPGIAYGVVLDGRLVHVGTHGVREVPTRAPVDSATVFRIASMTKSFTAAAILQLRDAGKLSLDAPAERYVPELRSLRGPTSDAPRVTVRDLLTHSAGFPEDNPWGDQQLAASEAELTRMLRAGIPFSTAPGTAYEYSNYGFAILGRIVANVGGMPYPRYLRERLLLPLGMRSTTLEARDVPPARLAYGYRSQDGQWLLEPALPDGAFGPMGGLLTTVADLSRWVAFLQDAWPARDGGDGGPLSRASRREMQQVWRYNGAVAARDSTGAPLLSAGGYGYGLGVRQTCLYRVSVSHTGGLPGYGSLMRWLPEEGVGIVALGNRTYTGWGGVAEEALGLLVRAGGLAPVPPAPAPVLLERQAQVARLLARWDDALADSVAAMNLYLDESKARRRAAYEKLAADAGGACRPDGALVPENALRGRFRMRCAGGDLRVFLTIAPTVPARVQQLDVSPMRRDDGLGAAPACR